MSDDKCKIVTDEQFKADMAIVLSALEDYLQEVKEAVEAVEDYPASDFHASTYDKVTAKTCNDFALDAAKMAARISSKTCEEAEAVSRVTAALEKEVEKWEREYGEYK